MRAMVDFSAGAVMSTIQPANQDETRSVVRCNNTAALDATGLKSGLGDTRLSEPPRPTDLPLFRFRLRQLFWFIAIVSTVLAAISSANGITALALLLATLVVTAHLFSTTLGHQLRWHADLAQRWNEQPGVPHPTCAHWTAQAGDATALPVPRRSPWHRRGSTSLPWLRRVVLAGILLGGVGGACVLAATIGHRTSPAGILVGSISLAVLGGWFAFLSGSFYGIFRHGLHEALTEQQNDETRR
jgi:hypothetical protein